MDGKIGIIGIGEPGYERQRADSLEEVVHEAAREALADAGVDRSEIDNVAVCASDLEDGRAISSMVAACPGGSYRRDFIKTTDTGVHALSLAAMRMATGAFDTTLVLSWAKESETDEGTIRPLEADPPYRRGTGLGHVTGHALNAAAYCESAADASEAAGAVVERNTANATDASVGLRDGVVERDDVADSEVVSWPLRASHLPEPCDGATALVLGTEDACEQSRNDPVWLSGLGWETDEYAAGAGRLGELPALSGAAERAYEEAGVDDPATDLDSVELHAKSAFHELMALEAAGIVEAGEAPRAVLDGTLADEAGPRVNASGGAFAANPLIATGLARVVAAARQIRDGEADRALAHSTAGFTDQVHGAAVLGGESR